MKCQSEKERPEKSGSMIMISKKDKKRLKRARGHIYFVSIKSSVLSTIHASTVTFFIVLLFQITSPDPFFIDMIVSLSISFMVYLIVSAHLFGSIILCIKLSVSYFLILKRKYLN